MRSGPIFVTGTGTDAGKTMVSEALVGWAIQAGHRCPALKPIETGCQPDPQDALRLAGACGQPGLAHDPAFYRVAPPLAPLAVEREGAAAPLDLDAIALGVRARLRAGEPGLVEGAGGLLVPLTRTQTVADLIRRLGLPVLLVAPNRLGVLSDVLAIAEAATARALDLRAVVLNRVSPEPDPSLVSNRAILAERLPCPVFEFPHLTGDPDRAARVLALDPGLPPALGWR